MKNIFNTIALIAPKRNHFDMSHDRKFSCDMGKLVPIHFQEVIPGDKISMKCTQLIRFAPLVSPMMHRVDVFTHFFFVPTRLLWSNWERFITGGDGVTPDPVFPFWNISPGDISPGTIPDYFGVPTGDGVHNAQMKISAMPFAAYSKIYDEYYRDQNLQQSIDLNLVDGDNGVALSAAGMADVPLNRAWEHDYFTSSLPFAQKGQDVIIPLGADAPVEYFNGNASTIYDTQFGFPAGSGDLGVVGPEGRLTDTNDTNKFYAVDNSSSLRVNLSDATSSSINDLRRAFKLQEWLERNARGGTRYIESILSHFGVRSSDARLQRPEYLGGGRSPVSISEVLQTSESVITPQGNLAGHGINVGQSHAFSKSFEEHGFIVGIMSVMPKPSYQQGLHRSLTKFDKLDYFWPSFANIGEQEVKMKEIFAGISNQEDTFGYVPRYAEYRFMPSTVHGDFRDTLSYWHLGRIFETPPNLNSDFIRCQPADRIFAVQDLPDDGSGDGPPVRNYHKLYCQVYHEIHALRPIPKFGIPTF